MKRLVIDIETAPNKVYSWGLFNQNIAINQIEEPGYVLCWAAKWYGEKKIHYGSIKDLGEEEMLSRIWDLLDEADVLIHYFGQSFDIPTLNREFIAQGWPMPSPSIHIDLLKTVRKQFKFVSNKLAYVAKHLKIGKKGASFDMEMWKACMRGDAKSWARMKVYNINDVNLTEALYDKLLPWISNHPNHALFHRADGPVCTTCGSSNLHRRGLARTRVFSYQRYRCMECGAWMRSRVRDKDAPSTELVGI